MKTGALNLGGEKDKETLCPSRFSESIHVNSTQASALKVRGYLPNLTVLYPVIHQFVNFPLSLLKAMKMRSFCCILSNMNFSQGP